MNLYPYSFTVTKNLSSNIIPMIDAEVYVYASNTGDEKNLFIDSSGNFGTELTQPLKTNSEGIVNFYCYPGRIRIDVKLDSTTIVSTEDVVGDVDSIVFPVLGETPVGTQDSSNPAFTLENEVYGSNAAVYVNGLRIARVSSSSSPDSGQFSVSGNTLIFGTPPAPNDVILVDYYPVPTNI